MKKVLSGLFFVFVPAILGTSNSAIAFEKCSIKDFSYTETNEKNLTLNYQTTQSLQYTLLNPSKADCSKAIKLLTQYKRITEDMGG